MIEEIRQRVIYGARNPHHEYRAERENGWHCGHWHPTPEKAARCFNNRWDSLLAPPVADPAPVWVPLSEPRIVDYIREALTTPVRR